MFCLPQLNFISELVIACHMVEWREEERALLLAIIPAAVSACMCACLYVILSLFHLILFTAANQKHIYYMAYT